MHLFQRNTQDGSNNKVIRQSSVRWNNLDEAFLSRRDGDWQVVRKEIQCAFNFVWKIMFSSLLVNIVLLFPDKSSTSSYCPNALLKLCFWPLFWNLLLLLPRPDCCPLKLLLFSHCPLTPRLLSRCPLKPPLPSCCPRKLWYPSRGPSNSGCSVATESCQRCESCDFSCTSVTDAVGISKQTPCFPLRPFPSLWNQYPHLAAL